MAGAYTDPPNKRFAWHEDGSALVLIQNGIATAATLTQRQNANGESNTTELNLGSAGNTYWGVVFPQLRNITHVYAQTENAGGLSRLTGLLQSSTNTTNLLDGTWTTVNGAFALTSGLIGTTWRSGIQSATMTGVKALRFGFTSSGGSNNTTMSHLHLYGTYATGQTPDRLELWHPTVDAPLSNYPAWFDWGDIVQGVSTTRAFRVKNMSSTFLATGVTVSFSALTDSSSAFTNAHTFSLDNTTFSSTASISAIAAGSISSTVYAKFAATSTQPISVWAGNVKAAATTWS
jgi:hypothetical protein